MNNQYDIGKRISSFELYDKIGPITGVALLLDDENELIAGDDSGYMLEISCPYGNQAMANNLLATLKGNYYQGFRAENAVLSPAAELGDDLLVNGVQSVLAHRVVNFGPGHMSEIAAPGESTMEHEFSWKSPYKKEFDRKIAQTQSMISKTTEQITLTVIAADGTESTIKLTEGGKIDLSGMVTFTALSGAPGEGTTARINGGWIEADTLVLTGAIKWSDLSEDAKSHIGSGDSSGITEDEANDIVSTYIDAWRVESPTLRGASIYGGVYHDDDGNASLYLDVDSVNGKYGMVLDDEHGELFSVWGGDSIVGSIALRGSDVLSLYGGVVYPMGTWDFSNATDVIGIVPTFG